MLWLRTWTICWSEIRQKIIRPMHQLQGHQRKECKKNTWCSTTRNHVSGYGSCTTFWTALVQVKKSQWGKSFKATFIEVEQHTSSLSNSKWTPQPICYSLLNSRISKNETTDDTNSIIVDGHGAENGFVWVRYGTITYVSCYLTPDEPIPCFQRKLDSLEDNREMIGSIIFGGDVNAKAVEWGMAYTDSRDKWISKMAARLGLTVMNAGSTTTFRIPGYGETIPDITLASEDIWKVSSTGGSWKTTTKVTTST